MNSQFDASLLCMETFDDLSLEDIDMVSLGADLDTRGMQYQYMIQREQESSVICRKDYNRRLMIDWISQIGEKFSMDKVTIHTAIAYLDAITNRMTLDRMSYSRQHLICICCIRISAKYNCPKQEFPRVAQFKKYNNHEYSSQEMHDLEKDILQCLSWKLMVIQPIHFLRNFASYQLLFSDDSFNEQPIFDEVIDSYMKYTEFFVDVCIQGRQFQKHRPSVVAAAILVASRRVLEISPLWRPELHIVTGYSWNAISNCLDEVWKHYLHKFSHATPSSFSPTSVTETSQASLNTVRSFSNRN